eukprot:scaffold13151_cov68-Phaeocystis_antarctica.AAC.3
MALMARVVAKVAKRATAMPCHDGEDDGDEQLSDIRGPHADQLEDVTKETQSHLQQESRLVSPRQRGALERANERLPAGLASRLSHAQPRLVGHLGIELAVVVVRFEPLAELGLCRRGAAVRLLLARARRLLGVLRFPDRVQIVHGGSLRLDKAKADLD